MAVKAGFCLFGSLSGEHPVLLGDAHLHPVDGYMLLGVVQEPGAQAHAVAVLLEDLEIPASLASFPEFRVVRKFGERYRPESKLVVHLHDSRSCGDAEYLGLREFPA